MRVACFNSTWFKTAISYVVLLYFNIRVVEYENLELIITNQYWNWKAPKITNLSSEFHTFLLWAHKVYSNQENLGVLHFHESSVLDLAQDA